MFAFTSLFVIITPAFADSVTIVVEFNFSGIDATDATPSNSLIILLGYGGDVSFLLTVDATFTTEEYLIQNHPIDIGIIKSSSWLKIF